MRTPAFPRLRSASSVPAAPTVAPVHARRWGAGPGAPTGDGHDAAASGGTSRRGAVIALVLAASLCAPPPLLASTAPSQAVATGRANWRVVRIVDGDTYLLAPPGGGKPIRIRMIGIDTPESVVNSKLRGDARRSGMAADTLVAWGARARRAAENLLAGEDLVVERGPEEKDRFGRQLAYLRRARDGVDIGARLVEQGWACAYARFRHPRREAYLGSEREARSSALPRAPLARMCKE